MKKVTLDVNVLHGQFNTGRPYHKDVRKLLSWHKRGLIKAHLTERIKKDIPRDPLRRQVISLDLEVVGAGFRLEFSRLDGEYRLHREDSARFIDEVMKILFPDKQPSARDYKKCLADADHLFGHKEAGHDVFITEDSKIYDKAVQLAKEGIVVCRVSEFIHVFESSL